MQRATFHSGVVHGAQFEREIQIVYAFSRVAENRKRTEVSDAQRRFHEEGQEEREVRISTLSHLEDQEYATRGGLLG